MLPTIDMTTPTWRERAIAVLRMRCPRCRRGRVFRSALAMNEKCPECGLALAREPGYFLGAMYFSYPIGVVLIGVLALIASALTGWAWDESLLVGWLVFLPLAPITFRASRVLWLHFDQLFDPR